MRAGELRHKITIQLNQPIRNSYGELEDNWINVTTVWASIEVLRGREYFAAQQINEQITAKITIRYITGITTKMRVLFKDRIFDILAVLNHDERNIELNLMCKESVPGG